MGFSFRNLFNDNAGGMTGGAEPGGGSLPPANGINGGGDRNALPSQAAPGGGVSPVPTNGAMPFDPQPTGRGNFEEMFAAGNRAAMGASGASPMPFGAAPAQQAGPRAVYTIGDLLQFIPPALATREAVSPEQQVQVELPADGSRDVKLSTLYQSCPQLFATEITPLNDSQLTLPESIGSVAPAAAVNPFGAPSIAHQSPPPAHQQAQTPVEQVAQDGAPVPNPFDPSFSQNPGGAPAMPPSSGVPPQQASMSPLSWHRPEPENPVEAAQPPQVPSQDGGAPQVGVNPFDPNPVSPPAQAPATQPAAGPVPIPAEPIEVAPEPEDVSDANSFPWASDAPSVAAGTPDDMPSPFSLEEDNPFFLAEDDDEDDFGTMATQSTDEVPSEPNASDPSAFTLPASPAVPEAAPAPQPFEQSQPPVQESAPMPQAAAPAQQVSPFEVQGSVFAQPPAQPEPAKISQNPFAQTSVPQAKTPEHDFASAPAAVPTEPERSQATAPTELPRAAAAPTEAPPSPMQTEAGVFEAAVEAEPEPATPALDLPPAPAAATWGNAQNATPAETLPASDDAIGLPSQTAPSYPAAELPNIEAPVAAAGAQPFAGIVQSTGPEAKLEVDAAPETPAAEVDLTSSAIPEAATPPPLPLSTAFAAAMPANPPVEEPEAASGMELPQPVIPVEKSSGAIRKSIFASAADEAAPEPLPTAESPASADTIKLPLIELLGGRSAESLGFSPQSLPDGAEAELPMSRIENQLSTGRVTVTLGDLAAAADREHGAILARGNQATEIDIPQNLLFHHLPEASPSTEPPAELVTPEAAAVRAPEVVEESVSSLPPVQSAPVAVEADEEVDAFAPAPADQVGNELPPSGASVGFSTPFSSFAKDDEFLAGPPSTETGPSEPEAEEEEKSSSVEDSSEADAPADHQKAAPAPVDWMMSIPGPLKGFGPKPAAASDMIEVEQPSSGLEKELLVEPPRHSPGLIAASDTSEQSEQTPIEKAGVPLFGGRADDRDDQDDPETTDADDFTIDSEDDEEVASFFTPSRPDSDELGIPSKRPVAEIDSLDTLPVLDNDDAETDLGGGFFDELPPPAFSFEDEFTPAVDREAGAEAEVGGEAGADEPAGETEAEIKETVEEEAVVVADKEISEDTIEPHTCDEPEIKPAEVTLPGAVTSAGNDRIRDIELRAVFATTEEFTLQRIAELTLELCSGIDSCDVLARGRTVSASRRGGAADGAEAVSRGKRAKAMYRNVRDLADNAGLAQAEELTLHTETHAVSFFTRGTACVTVHHERGDFRPGVREKLILVARGVAAFES